MTEPPRKAPYIPPIDPSNTGDMRFNETSPDMEPVAKDAEGVEAWTDSDKDTDTDSTESGDTTTASRSPSPSVHPQEAEVDVFDGSMFEGLHSVTIDDNEEDSDLSYEGDGEEDGSASRSPVPGEVKD